MRLRAHRMTRKERERQTLAQSGDHLELELLPVAAQPLSLRDRSEGLTWLPTCALLRAASFSRVAPQPPTTTADQLQQTSRAVESGVPQLCDPRGIRARLGRSGGHTVPVGEEIHPHRRRAAL